MQSTRCLLLFFDIRLNVMPPHVEQTAVTQCHLQLQRDESVRRAGQRPMMRLMHFSSQEVVLPSDKEKPKPVIQKLQSTFSMKSLKKKAKPESTR